MSAAMFDRTSPFLHDEARAVRDEMFGRRVFVRGVVEVSSYCRQNCHYCAMRRDNRRLARYRLAASELAEQLIHHRPATFTDIDLQAGEDPVAVREVVLPLVRALRRHTNLGITLCFGTLSPPEHDELREAGGDYCVIKIETGDAAHCQAIESPGTLAKRIAAIRHLDARGPALSAARCRRAGPGPS